MNLRRLSLASQILLLQLAVIVTAVAVGAAVSVVIARQQLDRTYEDRAITIGQSVASMPSVREAMRDSDPSRILQPLAEGIRKAAGATFVVIADRTGSRLSHRLREQGCRE